MFRWKILSDLNFLHILNIFLLILIAQFNNLVHGIVQIGNCSDGSPAVLPCDQESKICTGNPQMGCERHGPAYFCCGKLPNNENGRSNLMQSPSIPSFRNLPTDLQNQSQNCDDKFKQCEHWTRRGLCLMDMYKSETKAKLCPKSCKLCHLVPSKDIGPQPNGQGAQGQPQIHPDPPKPPPSNAINANSNSNIDPPKTLIKGKIGGVSPVQLPPKGTDPNGNIVPQIPNGNSPHLTNPTTVPPPTTTKAQGLLDSIWNKLTGRNASESGKGNPQSSTGPSLTSTNGQIWTTEKSNTVDPSWYDGFDMDEVKKFADGGWDEMDTERLGQKSADKMASTMSTAKSTSTTTNMPTVDPSWYDGFDMDEVKKMADGWDEMDTEKLGQKFAKENFTTPNSMSSTSTQMSTMPSSPLINASNLDVNSPGLFETIWDKLIGKNLSKNANLTSTQPPLTTMDQAFYEDDDERLNGKNWDWEKDQKEANNSTEKPANFTIMPNSTSPFPLLPSKIGGKTEPKKPRKLSPEEGELIHEKNIEETKKKNMEEENEGIGQKKEEEEEEKRNKKKKNVKEEKAKGKKKEKMEEEERRRDEEEGKRNEDGRKSRTKNKAEEEEEKDEGKRKKNEEEKKSKGKKKEKSEDEDEEKRRRDENEDEGKRKIERKNKVKDEEEEKEEKRKDEDEDEEKKKRKRKNKVKDEEEEKEKEKEKKRKDEDEDEEKKKRKRKNKVKDEEEEKEKEKEEKRKDEDEDEGKRKRKRKNRMEEDEYYSVEDDDDEENEEEEEEEEDYYDYEGSYSMEDEEDDEEEEHNNYWDQFRRGMHGIRDDVKKATIGKKNDKKVDWNEFKQKMHSLRG